MTLSRYGQMEYSKVLLLSYTSYCIKSRAGCLDTTTASTGKVHDQAVSHYHACALGHQVTSSTWAIIKCVSSRWVLSQCAAAGVSCIIVDCVHRYGMHGGFMMRQQAISAIHAKMLRLNNASIAAVSVGKVRPVLFDCCIMQGCEYHITCILPEVSGSNRLSKLYPPA